MGQEGGIEGEFIKITNAVGGGDMCRFVSQEGHFFKAEHTRTLCTCMNIIYT